MSHFWEGLLFGLVLQLSVGPVCVSVLQKGIADSFSEAFLMVLGVVLADATYIALALVGVSSIMKLEPLRIGIGLAGAALLAYFGLQNLRARERALRQTTPTGGPRSSLRYGFLLTLSNPMTILFWTGVFGGLIASTQFSTPIAAYIFGIGCLVATFVFLNGVAALGKFISAFVQPTILLWLNRAVGLFLIAFAIRLVVGVFMA